MDQRQGLSIGQAVVILIILSVVALVLVCIFRPVRGTAYELTNRTVCMSNLASIGKGIVLYKTDNDGKWPWIETASATWGTTPTGTSRDTAPDSPDGGRQAPRSITSLMFLLVRENQPVKLFVCPADPSATRDPNIVAYTDEQDPDEDEYYWDFSGADNVSYSYQAPVLGDGGFLSGVNDNLSGAVVIADKTPKALDPTWRPDDVSRSMSPKDVRRNMSPNHDGGEKINCLMVGLNVQQEYRPDCGINRDNIYTASGKTDGGSRSSVSLKLTDHLSSTDSFLIGPVGAGR